jgi:hypothetical protein
MCRKTSTFGDTHKKQLYRKIGLTKTRAHSTSAAKFKVYILGKILSSKFRFKALRAGLKTLAMVEWKRFLRVKNQRLKH